MSRVIDITGQRFGRLTVISRVENDKRGCAKWACICDCGNMITVLGTSLRSGHTSSCGCLAEERMHPTYQNSYSVDGDKALVKLPNCEKLLIADLDIWESQMSKYYWRMGSHGYARTTTGTDRKPINFHKLAFPDCPPGLVRDHIDGNKLNNCKSNIRFVTMHQNSQNRNLQKDSQSKRTGVTWLKNRRKWQASIRVNGKMIYLGKYKSLADAVAAREAAEIQYFGEYRRK